MNEPLLQTIWQHSLHRIPHLYTTDDECITVVEAGKINTDQGPDFLNAKILFQQLTWVGNVEIDIATSKWIQHNHINNPDYHNVVLHVVWEHDMPKAPHYFPIIALKNQVSKTFLDLYLKPLSTKTILCQHQLAQVDESIWGQWKSTLVTERFKEKTSRVLGLLRQQKGDWEQTFWIYLANYMGGIQNKLAFEQMAHSLPINVIYKEKNNLHSVEALLFGCIGALQQLNHDDEYTAALKLTYEHLAHKHRLQPSPYTLKYLRMRPYQFPDFRLAQLASLLFSMDRVIDLIMQEDNWKAILEKADENMNSYWATHFRLAKPSATNHSHRIGSTFMHTLIINVLLVMRLAYQSQHGSSALHHAQITLQQLAYEINSVTIFFQKMSGQKMKTAFDSQAFIHLMQHYCKEKKCLQCDVGNHLLMRDLHMQ